jgi:lipopolysaccharide transport system permease protein
MPAEATGERAAADGARAALPTKRPADGPVLRMDHHPVPMRDWLVGMWRFRGVLLALSRKDFQVRYKRAVLGILWSVALPLLQSVVLVFVFSRVGRFGSGASFSYAGFVLAGMAPWVYVSTCVAASTSSIVDASGLTDKVWFPRAILTLVPPCSNLVMLGASTAILLVALPIVGAPLEPRLVVLLPAAALAVAFTASLGMVLGALYVYFRDLRFMVQAALLVWLYVTPIVYPLSVLGGAGRWLNLNPLTGIVGLFQAAAVGSPRPAGTAIGVSVGSTLVLAVLAVFIHRHHDRLFVDLL